MNLLKKGLLKTKGFFTFSKQKRKETRQAYEQLKLNSMKLGVAYNLFDGEELLEASILSIREAVDYIIVVYQTISNYGNQTETDLKSLLDDLKKKGLVDECYEYIPDLSKKGAFNEKEKRNIGLNIARKKGCTHLLSMDTDEFYLIDEFKAAKEYIVKNNLDCTACGFFAYIKKPTYRIIQQVPGNVPFIHKIKWNTVLGGKKHFPVQVDPTRSVSPYGKFWLFNNNALMMHHMVGIRADLHKKYKNSSFNDIAATQYEERLERIKNIENYELGTLFENQHIFEVENVFNITVGM